MNKSSGIIVLIVVLLITLYLVPSVILNDTGSISGIIKMIGISGAVLAFFQPRIGIYIIAIEIGYLDYFKKLGTYYGLASQLTVIEILSMSMLTIGTLWLSILLKVTITRRGFKKHEWTFLFITAIWGAYSFLNGYGLTSGIQIAVNGAAIFIIALAISVLYDDPLDKCVKYTRHLFWILLPWCIKGMYQRFVGYSDMEMWYSMTNFSTTNIPFNEWYASQGYRLSTGFGSGKPAYGIVGLLYGFALWHLLIFKKHRAIWIIGFIIAFSASASAVSRTQLFVPMLTLLGYYLMRNRTTLRTFAIATVIGFVALLFASEHLVENLAYYDSLINVPGFEKTFRIQTMSPRLKSLVDFMDPIHWSFTGIVSPADFRSGNSGYYSHSALTDILYVYGWLGVLIVISGLIFGYITVEKAIFSNKVQGSKKFIRYGFSLIGLVVIFSLIGGSSFHTQPANLFYTAIIGMTLCSFGDNRKSAMFSV